jgi:probable HAF family extracellular repeat protein
LGHTLFIFGGESMRRLLGIVFSAALLLIGSARGIRAQEVRFYNLGHYPHGTWAEPRDINVSGVVVGFGDIRSGYIRPIGVPIFGPHAGQWFDLGTLGGDMTVNEVMCMAIADTGMIVGHAAIHGNEIVHAFAWTPQSGMVDIGTLADLGHSGYNFSLAYGTNKSGTLIAGWSGTGFESADTLPVVWTPKVVWNWGQWKTTWQIHKLDTNGFKGASAWTAMFANDSGQIIGTATTADGVQIGVVWNPLPNGEGWKIMKLPVFSNDYPSAEPTDINNNGEIVGDIATQDWSSYFPALWKPVEPSGKAYSVTVLPTLAGYLQGVGDGEGINDLGDIVGGSTDANGNYLATRWSTKDPHFVPMLLPAPTSPDGWSWATKVNNKGVAAGSYGNDYVAEDTVAWKFR